MHASVMDWAETMVEDWHLVESSVLEVGSADVNGSLRPLFTGPYIGVDLRPVKGVDVVASGNALPFKDNCFDVVVCTEVLAHDARPWLTAAEIHRVLKDDAVLLLSARGLGFGRQDSPHDYYRFTPEAVRALLSWAGLKSSYIQEDAAYSGTFAFARKAA